MKHLKTFESYGEDTLGAHLPKWKVVNNDQGHEYTHYVHADSEEQARIEFEAGHHGSIISIEPADKTAPKTWREEVKGESDRLSDILMGELRNKGIV